MNICVVGTGYVGLVTGACFAEFGNPVTCVDKDVTKIEALEQGRMPIFEPGLDDLVERNVKAGRLKFSTDLAEIVRESLVVFIAVGTPQGNDGRADLSFVRDVAKTIAQHLNSYKVVVTKSTVPAGTGKMIRQIIEENMGEAHPFSVASNPEFLREGSAIEDFMRPNRVVLGTEDEQSTAILEDLYRPLYLIETPIVTTDVLTAEMIKYASNSVLATMISFSNEIANLCATLGDIDVVEVLSGVHLDRRLSPILPGGRRLKPGFTTYLEAGCGFGGSCFPKDVQALVAQGRSAGSPMRILEAVMDVNRTQPHEIVKLLGRRYESLEGVNVTVLGLAFKPGTDDMRESPAIPVVSTLCSMGAQLTLHDPVAVEEAQKVLGTDGLKYSTDLAEAVEGAEVIVLLTRWPEYMSVPELVRHASPRPLVVDGRRLLGRDAVERYEGIGLRSTATASLESLGG